MSELFCFVTKLCFIALNSDTDHEFLKRNIPEKVLEIQLHSDAYHGCLKTYLNGCFTAKYVAD